MEVIRPSPPLEQVAGGEGKQIPPSVTTGQQLHEDWIVNYKSIMKTIHLVGSFF
jgi:hypothetical protein